MKLEIDTSRLASRGMSPDQYVLLGLLYHKEYNKIVRTFGKQRAIIIRNSLIPSKYILSDKTTTFKKTIISIANVSKLLGIRADKINFWNFYNIYPIRVGSRVLRAANPGSELAIKHEKKYLAKVKTLTDHKKAVEATEAFVNKQKIAGKLNYLPAMSTVLNNCLWQQWEEFIETVGSEGANWNTDDI